MKPPSTENVLPESEDKEVSEKETGTLSETALASFVKELRQSIAGEVRFDTTSRALYAADASNYRRVPVGVVIPRSTDDVVAAVAICRKYQVPLFNRGAGTALAGQTCNTAVCLDFSKYLNKIIEIDPDSRTARVQPGVILDHLRDAAEEYGLTFGPDPATHTHCTLGGMMGNNSCGIHSVMAGRTADNVIELDILTYDGARMRVGATSEAELEAIIGSGGRKAEIYAGLKELRDRHKEQIRKRYPDIPRRVSGYNLDELLAEKGFQVARALIGSESTCVTILEATLALISSPPHRSLLVLGYPDVFTAGDHIPQIMEYAPVGLEGLDRKLIEQMKKTGLHPRDIELLPEGDGWLLVEFGGESREEADGQAQKAMETLQKEDDPPSMKLFDKGEEEAQVWEIRESALGATAHVPQEGLAWPGWEDAAVDPSRLGGYLREFRKLMEKHGYEASLYGHFGQGCVHCRINFDLMTREGIDDYLRFIDEAADLVVSYGGSLSGEHGDGVARGALLEKMYGKDLVAGFRTFKSLWDPEGGMNPGKVVDAPPADQSLRLGADYAPWQPRSHYQYPGDGGSLSRASLRCVGVGKCRRTHDAFMCPSFLVTREEQHTTRGRAHMIFEMLRGDLVKGGWQSREVLASLDLCLGCKGCLSECPVDVDIATCKSEFLSHHYAGRRRPREHYLFANIDTLGRMASSVAPLANFLAQAPLLRAMAKEIANVHPDRPLPEFAPQSFSHWFAKRRPPEGEAEPVVLYPDCFNDFFTPRVLRATVRLLERWGYRVYVPKEHPALRPLIHFGMLERAKKALAEIVDLLAPAVRRGIKVVVVEPSTASVFKDEMKNLLANDRDAQRLKSHIRSLAEFILEGDLELPELQGNAVFHGHCHQKATLDSEGAKEVLRRIGLAFSEPQPGCCGMAGAFGFEKEHYRFSKKIGENQLLPSVRSAALDTWIVADGFSCRTQINDGSGRQALHTAELIEKGLYLNRRGSTVMTEKRQGRSPQEPPPVVVITGASAGLGRAISQAFARRGARLCLVARGEDRLREAQREVRYLGGEAIIVPGDVADPEVLERAGEEVENTYGPLDYWVNNAMVTIYAELGDIEPEEYKRVTEVTYLGCVNGTMAALKRMCRRDHGTIIQIGSALGQRGIPLQSAYCGAKHAINGFTESVRTELLHRKSNVHITIVQMPALNTPQFTWNRAKVPRNPQPVPPVYQPEVGAEAVMYAAKAKKKQIYLGFSTLQAIYGERLMPEILDHYAASSAWNSQMTDEPLAPDRPDNLFTPPEGLQSTHGPFDSMAKRKSVQLHLAKRKKRIGLGAMFLGIGAGAAYLFWQKAR